MSRLRVTSGEGATFRIRIPREGALPSTPPPDEPAAEPDLEYDLLPEVQPEA